MGNSNEIITHSKQYETILLRGLTALLSIAKCISSIILAGYEAEHISPMVLKEQCFQTFLKVSVKNLIYFKEQKEL